MARKAVARKAVNHQNRKSMLYISGILLIMLTVLVILSFRLNSQRKALLSEVEVFEVKKQEEIDRISELTRISRERPLTAQEQEEDNE